MATAETAKARRFGTTVRNGVVAAEVGLERVRYFVHKALLEEHSEYFKRALNGTWKEAEEKTVTLDDVECSTFEVFVDWLYTHKLPAADMEWVEEEYHPDKHIQWHTAVQIAMTKAYAFADRMLSPALRRALEHKLIDHFIVRNHTPYYGAVIHAFGHLPPTSPVLSAVMDAHCRDFDEARDTEENGEMKLRAQLPNTFLIGVMVRYAQRKAEKEVTLHRCDYHDHATEDEKKECQKTGPKPVGARKISNSHSGNSRRNATYGGVSDDGSTSETDGSTESDSDSGSDTDSDSDSDSD